MERASIYKALYTQVSIPYGKGKAFEMRERMEGADTVSIPYGKGKEHVASRGADGSVYQSPMGKVKLMLGKEKKMKNNFFRINPLWER